MNKERFCPRCKCQKPIFDFYKRRGKAGNSPYCKNCMKEQAKERQRRFKEICVQYKGGTCERCGYFRYIGALEFHHRDPEQKDFSVSQRRSLKFNHEVEAELDKCCLLCANCHREVHAEQKGLLALREEE
ncbi:MAG: hypothetical protein ACI8RZ_003472 [Myxococcota bacterium]|jgi:hypothetical protein